MTFAICTGLKRLHVPEIDDNLCILEVRLWEFPREKDACNLVKIFWRSENFVESVIFWKY